MAEERRGGARQGRPPAKRRSASGTGQGDPATRGRGRGGRSGGGGAGAASSRQAQGQAQGKGRGKDQGRRGGGRDRSEPGERGDRQDRGPRQGRTEPAGGGFGPYPVDQRDEETRERRSGRGGAEPRTTGGRPALRTVGKRSERDPTPRRTRRAQPSAPTRRRRKRGPSDVQQEMAKVAGRNANRALGTLMAAADAFAHDRERETLRILRPLRQQLPDSPSVRELTGLAQYRIGNYAAGAKELEAYADLSDSVDQNPVLMDCYRAQRRWRKVEELWLELASVSPSAELVAEGRIVYAGALADQGRLPEALALLRKRAEPVKTPKEHHLRLWYALADLEERAGNLARARELFHQVRRADPAFADVAERLAALG
jgi:hypothetical protein